MQASNTSTLDASISTAGAEAIDEETPINTAASPLIPHEYAVADLNNGRCARAIRFVNKAPARDRKNQAFRGLNRSLLAATTPTRNAETPVRRSAARAPIAVVSVHTHRTITDAGLHEAVNAVTAHSCTTPTSCPFRLKDKYRHIQPESVF